MLKSHWLLGVLIIGTAYNCEAWAQQPKKKPPAVDQTTVDSVQDVRIRSLESRVESSFAMLDCNTRVFDSLTMGSPRLLMFAVCRNIEPFLEGHRITFEVGNPHTFSFGGINGQLRYGKDWGEKSVDLNYAGELGAGRWTTLTVIINPSKPEDIRYLAVEFSAKTTVPGLR